MSIDFREFYAGQCFGAMSCVDGSYGADHIGADIDEELEAGVDEELFGAYTDGKSKRLKANFVRLQRLHRKAKSEHAIHKISGDRRSHKRLQAIKAKMSKVMYKIASIWRTMETDAKKEWAKMHKGSAKNPATYIKKYGPHKFQ